MAGDAGKLFTPLMIGDLLSTIDSGRSPVPAKGYKIGENESPRPSDRVFATFNYYDNVTPGAQSASGVGQVNIYREMFGFEKTFLNGNASIGLRLPLSTADIGSGNVFQADTKTELGDLTVVLKYAVMNNPANANLLSVGLAITPPTGESPTTFVNRNGPPGTFITFRDTILQPYTGYIWDLGDWYVHGFSSLAIPTNSGDVTVAFNDVGVGYWLYHDEANDARIGAIVPTFELHVNTPLNHGKRIRDSVDLTQGLSFELGHRAWLTLGVAENVTGPKTFDIEAIVHLNWRF
jgi:hypothetical protein